MAEFLAGIEQLAFVRGLKASFVAYPIVNALHIMAILPLNAFAGSLATRLGKASADARFD